ncbi:protein GSKIP homolog [Hyalella azteca]|uniref:Protein GSKIP homolog n=1 Tax=Hyalella azteca TaxID=294128 RepID=A0A8B7PPZ8_HYAAZ|nr:protein GSKIP homolog [Hyalella azteca]
MASSASKSPAYDEEKVLNAEEWLTEAYGIIKDVNECVSIITVSAIPATDSCVHLNLTTLELQDYTIELSAAGFRVVGRSHNEKTLPSDTYFETPYALLNNLSPAYGERFCSIVSAKLEAMAAQQLDHS